MKKKKKLSISGFQNSYTPTVIPDRITPLLEKSKENIRKHAEYLERKTKDYNLLVQQRISSTKEDRYIQAVNTIIEWVKAGKSTIPYRLFNFYLEEGHLFLSFLNTLKNEGCLSGWTMNPYKDAYHTEFIFNDISIPALKEYKRIYESENTKNTIVDFDGKNIIVGNEKIPFRNFRLDLLRLIFKNKRRKWNSDELFEKLEGKAFDQVENNKKYSSRLYSACNGINMIVGKKVGIEDFLDFSNYHVQLNAKYI